MMTVVPGRLGAERPGDLLNSLASRRLHHFAAEPPAFRGRASQLSFFVMLIIALMLPPLNGFFDRF